MSPANDDRTALDEASVGLPAKKISSAAPQVGDSGTTSTGFRGWLPPAGSTPRDLQFKWSPEISSTEIDEFPARWPPSRVPSSLGPWIHVTRSDRSSSAPNEEGLERDFAALISTNDVTTHSLDRISKKNNVVTGKWMVFKEPALVDALWGKILHRICADKDMKLEGSAKVSTRKEKASHAICVYVRDFTDTEEVASARKMLRDVGVTWKIRLKTDAYTHLGIYTSNSWNILPSRYTSN